MKNLIRILVFLLCCSVTEATAISGLNKPITKLCHFCSEEERALIASNIISSLGQTLYVVNYGEQMEIDEYKVVGTADSFTVELQSTHDASSPLVTKLKQELDNIEQARLNIKRHLTGVKLADNFTWESAFTALRAKEQATADIESYFNSHASLKLSLDVFDQSLKRITDTFGGAITSAIGKSKMAQVVTVEFSDNTAMDFELSFRRDISKSKKALEIGLTPRNALDSENNLIPSNLFALSRYKKGHKLTTGNTGNLNAFLGYIGSLGEVNIQVDNGLSTVNDARVVTDCKIKEGQDGVEIVCNSQNG